MNEQERINLAANGDVAAFNELVKVYQATAYRVALRLLRDQDAAADATQEAFISAYRHIRELRGEFKPWLLRIVANECYDALRRRKRHPVVSLDAAGPGEDEHALAKLASRDETPFEFASRRELGALVEKGLDTLSPDMRLTLVLIDVEGYSYEETAQIMETNSGTVRSRLARARGLMRDYLVSHRAFAPRRQPAAAARLPFAQVTLVGTVAATLLATMT